MGIKFPEIKNRFGFGCMRLPLLENGNVDIEEFKKMVDLALGAGCNYFDTAHVYIYGKSELAIKEALSKRYPRESFVLTDKLSSRTFTKEEEIIPMIESELAACGVDYFDFLLMHAQSEKNYEQYQNCHAYEKGVELRKLGKIKHLGISFHDTPEFLDKILTDHPEVEVVQLQFNYLDYHNPNVQSKGCYDVCLKHHKPVIVMEPIKGGELANLSEDAIKILKEELGEVNQSYASYALRFALSFDNNIVVLSGMSNLAQMEDNLKNCVPFVPLSEKEIKAINKVADYLSHEPLIGCTGCRYCVPGCPKHIAIPDLFRLSNRRKKLENIWSILGEYKETLEKGSSPASACIKCGACERICPQKLKIREHLEEVKKQFE